MLKKFDDMGIHLDTLPQRNRQKDGRTTNMPSVWCVR